MKLDDKQIKKILLEQNYLTAKDVKEAEKNIASRKITLYEYLLSEGIMTKNLYGQAIGEYFQVPFLDLDKQEIDNNVFNLIPQVVARSKGIIAVARTEQGVKLGMADPSDLETIHAVGKRVEDMVLPHYIIEGDLRLALERYEEDLKIKFQKYLAQLEGDSLDDESRDQITVELVNILLQYGHQNNASDIHIEPYAKKTVVRFRIDGVMHDVLEFPKDLLDFIITRIKILARMRTDEHRAAQDGKLKFFSEDTRIDVRVSVVPVSGGENIVLRLLAAKGRQYSLTDLGFSEPDFKKLRRSIKSPHGMILVTGPTGSGKTTTLYAVLKILNKREVHISTIEDPIEYDIEGVSQIQVDERTNLTFAKGLRAIVRQDPDIIMVGEIRDEETANIAVNAALTGHLVLSTLHTNDAATTLPRLIDMKVEPFLVASTINTIIAQRLVRKVCEHCRASYGFSKEEIAIIESTPYLKEILKKKGYKNLTKVRSYKGAGCSICNHSGYSGRIGIFEVLEMSDDIKEMILKQASSLEINEIAKKNGMTTMFEDGIEKVLNGITTIEEVMRVSRE